MRVAFIHPFLYRYPRGIERYTYGLANALARRGVEVHILTWDWSLPIYIDTFDSSVQIHVFPTSRFYAAQAIVPFYAWHLWRHPYDFVWIFFAGYGEAETLSLIRRQRFGIALNYPFAQVPHRYREFKRYNLAERAASIVSVSRFVADGAKEAFGCDSEIISNGVDANRFQPDATLRTKHRAMLGLADSDLVLLTSAALEERKGIQFVLNALPHILKSQPNLKYIVVGTGPYRTALEDQIRSNHLDACVKFFGATSDIKPYYNAADVFILLSKGEALPLSVLEAMAMQLPLVTSVHPPFDEIVLTEYGLRVSPQDSDCITGTIIGLLNDPQRRNAMGTAARSKVLCEFTWDRIAVQYAGAMKHAIVDELSALQTPR